MLPGNQGSSERPHDAGDVRADSLAAGNPFKTPENGIVVKRTALNDNVFAEVFRVRQLDDFQQGVLDNGYRKSRRDIRNRGTLFLCLFDFGVHKYRAPGT